MREQCKDGANITDWIYDRFGPIAWVYCCIVFIYYMFLYMTGQLKTVGDMVTKYTGDVGAICPGPDHGVIACTGAADGLHGIIPVVIVSIFVFAEVDFTDASWAGTAEQEVVKG